MIRVAVFTDEPILAEGLKSLFCHEGDFELIWLANGPDQLTELAAAHKPDVLLVDAAAPLTLGLLAALRLSVPDCKLAVMVRAMPPEQAFQAIELGVRGILYKTRPLNELPGCLRRIASGELIFDQRLTQQFPSLESLERVELTPRESQLLTLLTHGMKNRQMAAALSITEGTVKVYLSRLYHKTGLRDRHQLALYGVRSAPVMGGFQHALENGADPAQAVGRRGEPARPLSRSRANGNGG